MKRKPIKSTLLQGWALIAEASRLLEVIEADIKDGLSSPSSHNLDWMDLSKVRDLRERLQAWQPDPITADAQNLYATIRKLIDDISNKRHSEELYGDWLATARQAVRRATGEEV